MISETHKKFVYLAITFCLGLFLMNRPLESAKRYQYRVLSVSAVKELRTQSDTQQGRLKTIENLIEEQTSQGWEFYQADGFVLYFRK